MLAVRMFFLCCQLDDDIGMWEGTTPLYEAVMYARPDLVDMLLQARADPDECGYELELHGENVHPDGGHHSDCESPLWRAVHNACRNHPVSKGGIIAREILQSLMEEKNLLAK